MCVCGYQYVSKLLESVPPPTKRKHPFTFVDALNKWETHGIFGTPKFHDVCSAVSMGPPRIMSYITCAET